MRKKTLLQILGNIYPQTLKKLSYGLENSFDSVRINKTAFFETLLKLAQGEKAQKDLRAQSVSSSAPKSQTRIDPSSQRIKSNQINLNRLEYVFSENITGTSKADYLSNFVEAMIRQNVIPRSFKEDLFFALSLKANDDKYISNNPVSEIINFLERQLRGEKMPDRIKNRLRDFIASALNQINQSPKPSSSSKQTNTSPSEAEIICLNFVSLTKDILKSLSYNPQNSRKSLDDIFKAIAELEKISQNPNLLEKAKAAYNSVLRFLPSLRSNLSLLVKEKDDLLRYSDPTFLIQRDKLLQNLLNIAKTEISDRHNKPRNGDVSDISTARSAATKRGPSRATRESANLTAV
ncbi:MAG: hypothetical protein SFT81_02020 [Candidatus Caenarcaniphilales bacterium]|nr:hypothetical protein [Candidatus Caenarcaniphilales bacterium]